LKKAMSQYSGTVKFFDVRKGFGFLSCPSFPEGVFVGAKAALLPPGEYLTDGDAVTFASPTDTRADGTSPASARPGPSRAGSDLDPRGRPLMAKQETATATSQSEEIEITPEMIEAGAQELDVFVAQDLAEGFITRWEVAEAVYRAMLRVARSKTLGRRDIF
jgi:cold shock CspA family protein